MAFNGIEFITIVGAFLVGAISPGPDFAMVLRQSISHGRGAAIVTSAGIGAAILVHGTYTILGLGLVISRSIFLFSLLKYVGAAYLIWLGIGALRAPAPVPVRKDERVEMVPAGWGGAFAIGFLTNLLNPKVALFFVALFTTVVGSQTPLVHRVVYIGVMASLLFMWFVLVSFVFTTPAVRDRFYRMGVWFNRVTGLALIGLALKLAVTQKA